MSAAEFGEWIVMMRNEQLHPAAERLRHAQLLAAAHNGPMNRKNKQAFASAEFLPADPWASPAPAKPAAAADAVAASVAAINAQMKALRPGAGRNGARA